MLNKKLKQVAKSLFSQKEEINLKDFDIREDLTLFPEIKCRSYLVEQQHALIYKDDGKMEKVRFKWDFCEQLELLLKTAQKFLENNYKTVRSYQIKKGVITFFDVNGTEYTKGKIIMEKGHDDVTLVAPHGHAGFNL